ncbi:MAG: hypothetical protein U0264_04305 [Candidatus Kapaibacterium sp.]
MKNFIYSIIIVGLMLCHFSCFAFSFLTIDSTKQIKQDITLDELIENPPFTSDEAILNWKKDSLTCLGLRSALSFYVIKKKIKLEGQYLSFLVELLGAPNDVEQLPRCIDRGNLTTLPQHNICYLVTYYFGRNCNENSEKPIHFHGSLAVRFIIDAATSRIISVEF